MNGTSQARDDAYDSEATGPLAGTGAGRTARKADTGAGFHPATRPNVFALSWSVILEAAAALEAAAWLAWVRA